MEPFKDDVERTRKHKIGIKRNEKRIIREGELPSDKEQRTIYVHELLEWIWNLAPWNTSFHFQLARSPISEGSEPTDTLLSYHEWSFWSVNLFPTQFRELQEMLISKGFPADTYYPFTAQVCAPWQPTSLIGRFFQKIGFTSQHCYSPKEWEEKQGSNKRKNYPLV